MLDIISVQECFNHGYAALFLQILAGVYRFLTFEDELFNIYRQDHNFFYNPPELE